MKKLRNLIVAVLMTAITFAQAPDKMSYQAVIRNTSGNIVANQKVGMQLSILKGSASGTSVYTETQTPTSNTNGLVTLKLGTGNTTDDFNTIDWTNGPFFIKTETDLTGGANYTITGTSELLSVPYALQAKQANKATDLNILDQTIGDLVTYDGTNWIAKNALVSNTGSNLPINNMQPYTVVNYIIALQGLFPVRNSISDPTLAEITMFGGNFAPRNWAFCDGQLLSIATNTALFSLIGTLYGGDGRTTFALPDLRGRTAIHFGTGPGLSTRQIGEKGGSETNTMTLSQLPSHNHTIIYQ